LAGPRSTTRPLPHDAVLLTYAGLVLPPDFDRRVLGQVAKMRAQRACEVFLYASTISPS
jgi:hypothetical protein